MTDFETRAPALRKWAATQDAHVRAAADLLLWHEFWIRRRDFARWALVKRSGGILVISWEQARAFLGTQPHASTSELAVLDLAVAIGENRYELSQFGDAHARAIVAAFGQALGIEVTDG